MFKFKPTVDLKRFYRKMKRVTQRIGGAIDDSTEFTSEIVLAHTLQRFETLGANRRAQRSPKRSQWPRPAQATLESRKVNRDGTNQALVDTGKLRDSIYVRTTDKGKKRIVQTGIRPGVFYKKRKGRIAVSTVARYMEQGTSNVPPRPFSGMDDDTREEISNGVFRRVKAAVSGFN